MAVSTGPAAGRDGRSERRLSVANAVTRALAEAETLGQAAPAVLETLSEGFGWDAAVLWEVDRAPGVLWCVDARATDRGAARFVDATRAVTFERGAGIPGRVWASGEPIWMADPRRERSGRARTAKSAGLRGGHGFPIGFGAEVLGVLEFFTRESVEADVGLVEQLSAIASQLGQFVERIRTVEELRFQKTLLEAQSQAAIDGVLVVADDGRIVWFNERFVDLWDIPRDVIETRSDEAALTAVRDKLVDPQAFLNRVLDLYEHADAEGRDEIRLKDGRIFDRYSAPVRGPGGERYGRAWYFRDITAEKREEDTLRFLANVSDVLSWSLDYRRTMQRLARLAVPALADWCVIYVRGEAGSIERVAFEHADPTKRALAETIQTRFHIDPAARAGVPEVIRSGQSQLHPEASIELLAEDVVEREEQIAAVRGVLEVSSWMCVPLSARGRTFGAMSFIAAESGRRYGPEDLAVAEEIARRAALAIDNVRLYQERDHVAETLQHSLLPPRLPEVPGMELAGRYVAGGDGVEVGGDFYDAFDVGNGAWGVVIGDVCGKGPDAAAVMAQARYALRATGPREVLPSRVLLAVNRDLLERPEVPFCTVCYALLTPIGRGARVILSSAGHPLPVALRADGRVEEIGVPGTLLGVLPDPPVTDAPAHLEPGDSLILFTDGVVEREPPGKAFWEDGLRQELRGCAGLSAGEIAERVERFSRRPDAPPRRDDVAVLVLRVRPGD